MLFGVAEAQQLLRAIPELEGLANGLGKCLVTEQAHSARCLVTLSAALGPCGAAASPEGVFPHSGAALSRWNCGLNI